MAKFGSYFALCPLIDSNSLLGVTEDVEKGVVIVTLGKNISARYKVSLLHIWLHLLFDDRELKSIVLIYFLSTILFPSLNDVHILDCFQFFQFCRK